MSTTSVFHESFDSTRTTANDSPQHPNLAQAQVEAVISLLLGRSLAIINSYAFDSRSVLELSATVLAARRKILLEAGGKHSAARERLQSATPFHLFVYGSEVFTPSSFFEASATQLRKYSSKQNSFRLSAWRTINTDDEKRGQLADALQTPGGPVAPDWIDSEHPELRPTFEALRELNEHAVGHVTVKTNLNIQGLVEHFEQLPSDMLAELVGPDEERLEAVLRVQAASLSKADAGKGSRTWAHDAVEEAGDDAERFLFQQVREVVDTFYNAVLSESAGARFGYMSSVPRVDGRKEIKWANDLALQVIRRMTGAESTPQSLRGMFSAVDHAPVVKDSSLSKIFEAYWSLVADEDRWPIWQQSCARLDRLLRAPEPDMGELRHEWNAHLSTLESHLPRIVRHHDDGRLILRGGGYAQTHSLELSALSDEEQSTILATGEYMSILRGRGR